MKDTQIWGFLKTRPMSTASIGAAALVGAFVGHYFSYRALMIEVKKGEIRQSEMKQAIETFESNINLELKLISAEQRVISHELKLISQFIHSK